MDELCQDAVQIVVLGTGEERYENMFRHFDWKYHGKVSAQIYYDEPLSHRIYAASDAFLMPSLFEPCGLSQLMSLRYGTLPIVRETGFNCFIRSASRKALRLHQNNPMRQ